MRRLCSSDSTHLASAYSDTRQADEKIQPLSAWSLKESAQCLYDDLEPALASIFDRDIRIGRRLDYEKLVSDEAALGWESAGVVACRPGSLCDGIRAAVIRAAKSRKTEFELEIEAYS